MLYILQLIGQRRNRNAYTRGRCSTRSRARACAAARSCATSDERKPCDVNAAAPSIIIITMRLPNVLPESQRSGLPIPPRTKSQSRTDNVCGHTLYAYTNIVRNGFFFLSLLRGVPTKLFSRGEHIFNSTRPIRLLTLAPTKTKKFNLKINADQSPVTTS